MELLEPEKVKYWPERLKEFGIGEKRLIPFKHANTVRGAISRYLPDSGCEMEFSTETVYPELKVKGKLTKVKCIEVVRLS